MSTRWSGVPSWYRIRYVSGDEVDIQVRIPDVLRWEQNNNGRSLLTGQSVTAMLQVVFYALRRSHLVEEPEFAVWVNTVDDFAQMDAPEGEASELVPTSPDQSAD